MQLYGFPPYLEDSWEMAAPVEPYLGPGAFPFAPELGDLGLFMDEDIDVDIYFDKMKASPFTPQVTLTIDEEFSGEEKESDSF